MKFNELFTYENGIFTLFDKEYPQDFALLFGGGLNAVQLNIMAVSRFGHRTLAHYVKEDTWEVLVSTYISTKMQDWLRTMEAMTAKYDVLQPYKETKSRTFSTTEDTDTSDEKLSGKKPFNEPDFSFDGKEQKTGSRSQNRTDTDETETVKSGARYTVAEYIREEIEVRRYNYQQDIIKQIVDEITVSVYE